MVFQSNFKVFPPPMYIVIRCYTVSCVIGLCCHPLISCTEASKKGQNFETPNQRIGWCYGIIYSCHTTEVFCQPWVTIKWPLRVRFWELWLWLDRDTPCT
ncbi:hypothetical protein GBAR_LOCUS18370 [Geodia barretti]|uniref:Uncharacterized protein n=1 Tax=Geodia barretti TaxID=519541 RepID=A0AA35WZJ7_GEOBA|nr:hypothetical protein GBAR_LOCUS18370 [Geodia barretti]